MQWVNIFLFWLFFGTLCSFLAKKKQKNPTIWFFIGLFLGIMGVALIFVISWIEKKKKKFLLKTATFSPQVSDHKEYWNSFWYYIDLSNQQSGPIEFITLTEVWKKQKLNEESYVWKEGMEEWKKIREIPHLLQNLKLD
jgi:glucan phosphoethanolaminetransferase (alkaline phosphatase superfamily)